MEPGLIVLVVVLFIIFCPSASERTYHDRSDYFGGRVRVEYFRTLPDGDDSVTITFNRPGYYEISFNFGCDDCKRGNMPDDFTIVVNQVPFTKVLEEDDLIHCLKVSVSVAGIEEVQIFE